MIAGRFIEENAPQHEAYLAEKAHIAQIAALFRAPGSFIGSETLSQGNINATYRVDFRQADSSVRSFILQRVNTYVFPHPVEIMENIRKVTAHISSKVSDKPVLHFYETASGENYYIENAGAFWRMTDCITGVCYDSVDSLDVLRNAGRAFGDFQNQLADFPADALYTTIPDFHNTAKRLETFFAAVEADKCGRVSEAGDEIAFIRAHAALASELTHMQEAGKVPLRVTHNDTKTNNVIMDRTTGEPLTVIDLDTVMPGLAMHDFGDAVRFAANTAAEDEPDTAKVSLDLAKFRAFAEGFIGSTAGALTEKEIGTMALGAITITIELAVRFLTDYLMGDPYFKINYPTHNLVRARCQIALAEDMLKKRALMEQTVQEIAAGK